jgi:hypothetical protein
MSSDTRELIQISEQLPHAQRLEVIDFARSLLAKSAGVEQREAAERWLSTARASLSTNCWR